MTYVIFGVVLTLFIAAWGLLYLLRRETYKRAELKEMNKSQNEVFEDVKKALDARDRLRTDPDYALRVRKRFTRD